MDANLLNFRPSDPSANPQRACELEAAARVRILDGLQVGDAIRIRYSEWPDGEWRQHVLVGWSKRGNLLTRNVGGRAKSSWPRWYFSLNGAWEIAIVSLASEVKYPEMVRLSSNDVNAVVDRRYVIVQIRGDSMSPDFEDGWRVLIDTKGEPRHGDLVVVHMRGQGSILGRWSPKGDHVELERTNPSYAPFALGDLSWRVGGIVVKIVGRAAGCGM